MRWLVLILEIVGIWVGALAAVRAWAGRRRWPDPIVHPNFCDQCDRRFNSSQMLASHIRGQHHETYGPIKTHLDNLRARAKPRRKKPKLRLVK